MNSKLHIRFPSILQGARLRGLAAVGAGLLGGMAARAAPSDAKPATLVRLEELLWRPVQDMKGAELGGVSDILVQMPSGGIVFVAINPSELFQRPKAVPPGALEVPAAAGAPVRLNIPRERWISAPLLDWNSAMVIQNTDEGRKIYGYYAQAWREPDPSPPWGVKAVTTPSGPPDVARYVSLKTLLLDRIVANGGESIGYLREFLIDWPAKRTIYALVSPRFTPLVQADDMWFAIPLPLLNPPVEDDAITVNHSVDAFRRASNWPADGKVPRPDGVTVYRYPVGSRLAGTPKRD